MEQIHNIALITDKLNKTSYNEHITLLESPLVKKQYVYEENSAFLEYLMGKGLNISVETWDDEKVDWSQYDFLILHTTWDYAEKIDSFKTWLDKIEKLKVKVLNPIKAIRWNMDKIYFQDIQKAGNWKHVDKGPGSTTTPAIKQDL